jgi:hypothetical protein
MSHKLLVRLLILSVAGLTVPNVVRSYFQQKEAASKLEARLVAKKDTYELDLVGKTAEQIQQLPWQTKLEVVLILHNPTAKDIKLIIDPDDGFSPKLGLSLEVKGPKVVASSSPRSPQTMSRWLLQHRPVGANEGGQVGADGASVKHLTSFWTAFWAG